MVLDWLYSHPEGGPEGLSKDKAERRLINNEKHI
jgi:hypothetical protein